MCIGDVFLYIHEEYSSVWKHHNLCTHSPVDIHLDVSSFPYWVNNAGRNISVQISLSDVFSFLLHKYTGIQFLGHEEM